MDLLIYVSEFHQQYELKAFIHHGDTEITEGIFFLSNRETPEE